MKLGEFYTDENGVLQEHRGRTRTSGKLREADVYEIHAAYAHGGKSYRELAAAYDVTPMTIANIVHKRTWKDVGALHDYTPTPRSVTGKLTLPLAREIRARYAAGGISQAALAAQYGVTLLTIAKVLHNQSWKEQ